MGNSERPALLITLENQVRQLDAKLLLSLVASERGFSPDSTLDRI